MRILTLILALALPAFAQLRADRPAGRVLVYEPLSSDAMATYIGPATVVLHTASSWSLLTASDFATADAIWIGDGSSSVMDWAPVVNSLPLWRPEVSRVLLSGLDPNNHAANSPLRTRLSVAWTVNWSVDWLLEARGGAGVYIGTDFASGAADPLLSAFGAVTLGSMSADQIQVVGAELGEVLTNTHVSHWLVSAHSLLWAPGVLVAEALHWTSAWEPVMWAWDLPLFPDVCAPCGDTNGDGRLTVIDGIAMHEFIRIGAYERCLDVNGDWVLTIADIHYLYAALFKLVPLMCPV